MVNVSKSVTYSQIGQPFSGVMARSATPQIGASHLAISEYLSSNAGKVYNAFMIFNSLQFRNTMYQQYKINRSEMWCLCALQGYLTTHNKVLVSQNVFTSYLSGTFITKKKIHGFIQGLFTLKCIGSFEYTKVAGSLSIGITDFGFEVLRAYFDEMNQLFGRYMTEDNKSKTLVKYPDLSADTSISIAENIPLNYRPIQKSA